MGSPRGDTLALTLNTPPSFHNPKSVLVAALPAVEQQQLPPLHAVDPKEIYCARKTSLVLPSVFMSAPTCGRGDPRIASKSGDLNSISKSMSWPCST